MTPTAILCLCLILLSLLAAAGISLLNAGLGRSRNAAHAMLASLSVMSVAAITYCVIGFSWQGSAGGAAHALSLAGKDWNWIAAEPLFLGGRALDGSPAALVVLLETISVGIAALIPLGSGAERWRLGASCGSSAILAGWTYPLFAHWVWGGGWLAQLGVNYNLGHGFLDAGGASTIHVSGGFTALAVAWILGPRGGKYAPDGAPAAIPGHNALVVLFACFLMWLGWLGLNGAGAMLFANANAGRTVLVAVNTTLSAAASLLAAIAVSGAHFGKPDASVCANGWTGGLVASSAVCAFVSPAAAIVTGAVAGALVAVTVAYIEWPLAIDDPGGAISVHAAAGLWGLFAVGIFARFPDAAESQWLAQLIGIATLVGFILPMTYALNWTLNLIYPMRVTSEGERQGMDLHELGAGAYPEFVTHTEEFTGQ